MTQAPPPQPPQTPQPPQAPTGMPVKPHRGTLVLVFGILGLCCIIFPILAWVWGSNDLKEMAAGRMDRSGEGLTKAGKIIGMIFTILGAIGILINIIALATGGSLMFSMGAH